MPIPDLQVAAQKIAAFISSLNQHGGMRLKYRISAGETVHDIDGNEIRQLVGIRAPVALVVIDGPQQLASDLRAQRAKEVARRNAVRK